MTKSHQMQQLEAVLGSYGSDSARWPPAERAALEAFIADNADAAARLAEEASFDQLLGLAPARSSPAAAERAKDRLLARFEDEIAASTGSSATVVPFAPRAAKAAIGVAPRSLWRELSVMAAALLIGFFTVSQGVLDGTSLDPSQLAAATLSTGDADDVSAIALGTTGDENSEEDLL